ncbi:ABC transporter ATP-binding protein [Alicyclobacillus kakegawensis]|uniref:ABC transporter ATP-binding protein n=1 Tax=Alicyclobacillus kakegawensis TaxID=392012 RepID=UPI0008325528|nr:ATP-binding cassette domain-containing protein [Alicyclobacillus kakegawensis]
MASTVPERRFLNDGGNRDSTGARVEVDGIVRQFGANRVLNNLEFTVEAGEFIAVVGKSGCGKSTLLRILSGLDKPNNGALRVDGQRIDGLTPRTRVVFQDARLLPWQRVVDNVALGLPAERRHEAEQALEWVGLADKAWEWPARLSGGQKQRVALARALVWRPRLLLMDEPLGALDALTRLEMQRLIERTWVERGFTAILVTHDISEAVMLGDRVLLLEAGGVAMDVRIDLERPRRRTEAFDRFEEAILSRILGREASYPASQGDGEPETGRPTPTPLAAQS